MLKATSFSHMTSGLVAVIVGYASSVAIIFQAAAGAGATPAEISSWLLALGVGMGLTSIGLSLYYRIPIMTAWSTPGAALLVIGLSGASMPEAIGAFIVSAVLIILSGVTGFFEKAIAHIPRSLAAAMLAGILFQFGTNIFVAMQQQLLLVVTMFITYLIAKYLFPRFAILIVFLLGTLIAGLMGLFHLEHLNITLSAPILTTPEFTFATIIGIAIPLFLVTMTSQNIPGLAVIKASGYEAPVSSIISWTGLINLLIAPFGGFAINLAAITAAICLSKGADPNPTTRYKAAVCAGAFYLIAGLFGATVVTLFMAMPRPLVLAIAGLALLTSIGNSLKTAIDDESQCEAALITFLVSASNISLFGIGAAFWGLVAGVFALIILKLFKNKADLSNHYIVSMLKKLRQ